MALKFTTDTVSVKRLVTTTGIKKEYQTVLSNISVDIQPISKNSQWEILLQDSVQANYIMFYETSDESAIVYNDTVIAWSKTYIVEWTSFWKGGWKLPNSLEVILSLNKTWE